MKKLIVNVFKTLLNLEVRVINLPDEEIDMGIYIVHDKKMRKMDEKALAEISPDYAITRSGKEYDNWIYMIGYGTDGVTRMGEVVSPPDFDYKESMVSYRESETALRELIIDIIKESFDDLLMCREEMNEI